MSVNKLEQILQIEKNILEMIVIGRHAAIIGSKICKQIESVIEGSLCSILELRGDRLSAFVGPSLGADFVQAVEGMPVGDGIGAALTQGELIIESIDDDPKWRNFLDLAKQYGLESCWSKPIFDSIGNIQGVFSIYFNRPTLPVDRDRQFLDRAAKLASISLERDKIERKLEEQRMQLVASAKLTSLGEMASGIAHEINNPLTIINGYASNLMDMIDTENPNPEEMKAMLQKVMNTTDRISKIIKGLKMFSRDGSNDPKQSVDIVRVLQDTTSFCHQRFKVNGVTLTLNPPSATVMVSCRPVQISQVILNLLNNAFDAVKGTQNAWIRIDLNIKENFVDVIIADSGIGIKNEIVDKIMLPFFTTKDIGQGTGLGLSISNTIIKDHGGSLYLDKSAPNTTFVVQMPF